MGGTPSPQTYPPALSHFLLQGSAAAVNHFSKISGLQKKQLGKYCATPTCCLLTFIKIPMGLSPDEFLERYQDTCKIDGCTSWAFLMGQVLTGNMEIMHFYHSLSQHLAQFVIIYLLVCLFIFCLDWTGNSRLEILGGQEQCHFYFCIPQHLTYKSFQ